MLKQLNKLSLVEPNDEESTPVLNTRVKPIVRILNASLDDDPMSPRGVILQGRIDPATLRFLKVDHDYQRPLSERPDIFEAIKRGAVVPNIEVGVRGQDFVSSGNTVEISSPVFIIDGWQRVGNALRLLELVPDTPVRMFVTAHFGTDNIWERHRFTELNTNTRRVSASLHLRNLRDGNDAVTTLYGLTNNTKDFPLYKRVSWSQNMKRGELMQAYSIARVVSRLHAHLGRTNVNSASGRLSSSLAAQAQKASLPIFRKNVTTFFNLVDECWDIRNIEYAKSSPQVRVGFLLSLAKFMSDHADFWDDETQTELFVNADIRRKLAKFPINDPHIKSLSGSGSGPTVLLLVDYLVRHLNSGKRTHRLQSRYEK